MDTMKGLTEIQLSDVFDAVSSKLTLIGLGVVLSSYILASVGNAYVASIILDQNRRRLIDRAHKIGRPPVWDYQPMTDASRQWVRAGKWTVEVEAEAHLDVR